MDLPRDDFNLLLSLVQHETTIETAQRGRIVRALRAELNRPMVTYLLEPQADGRWLIGELGSADAHKPPRELIGLARVRLALRYPWEDVAVHHFRESGTSPNAIRGSVRAARDWLEVLCPALAVEVGRIRVGSVNGWLTYQPSAQSPRVITST